MPTEDDTLAQKNTDLLAAIDSWADQATGSLTDGGELSRQRQRALQRYAGINLEPAPDGRSQVVDRTVFETTQWIMPSVIRVFAGEDNIVEFEPTSEEDVEVAQQESDYLNYLVTQRNDWDLTVRTWAQDALVTKNAYCLVHMEEKILTESEMYEGQTPEQLALLLEDDVTIVSQRERPNEEAEPQMVDPSTGELIAEEDVPTMVGAMALYESSGMEPQFRLPSIYDVEIVRTKPVRRLAFQVLPPERCRVGEDTPDFTLETCNYFEYWDTTTLSELRAEGFDVPDDIADSANETTRDTLEDEARDELLELDLDNDNPDPAMRQVIRRDVWVRYDYDGDGIAELQHVVIVGREILERESVSTIPVACIVPYINTHRHNGNSVADLVEDIQRIKTKMLRTGLDALDYALRPESVVSNDVVLSDFQTSRPGGVKRLKKGALPGEGHVMPMVTPNVFPDAQNGLEYMDRVIESRVGVNRIFQGIDESNLNDHNRIGQLSTMAAQRVEDILRIFGSGFKRLFAIAHELLIKSGHSREVIRLRGQFVTIDPSQWRTGRDMRVVAPYAAGNKDALVQRLMIHMNVHREALAAGAPFVQIDDTYELAKMLAAATDVPGDRIYTDPATVEPPPPAPDHTMLAIESENMKTQQKEAEAVRENETKQLELQIESEDKRYAVDRNAETQITIAAMKDESGKTLERVRADLKNKPIELENELIRQTVQAVNELREASTDAITELRVAVAELQEQAGADIEPIREGGRLVGVRRNGRVVRINDG